MIPRIIHYCWFGKGEMPELTLRCIESWHRHMPDFDYMLWNEDSFDINSNQYAREAYEARKYAFVSDVVRLKALSEFGGLYFDTDVMVYKSLEPLLFYKAFAGYEGSKYSPVGTCVLGSEKSGTWVHEQLNYYNTRHFVKEDGSYDLTTNVAFMTGKMKENGFVANGIEQDYKDLHIFPVDFFSPRHTTGAYIRTDNTYCDHLGMGSWSRSSKSWKSIVLSVMSPSVRTRIIEFKRKLFG